MARQSSLFWWDLLLYACGDSGTSTDHGIIEALVAVEQQRNNANATRQIPSHDPEKSGLAMEH
jgi:hypothetical protein